MRGPGLWTVLPCGHGSPQTSGIGVSQETAKSADAPKAPPQSQGAGGSKTYFETVSLGMETISQDRFRDLWLSFAFASTCSPPGCVEDPARNTVGGALCQGVHLDPALGADELAPPYGSFSWQINVFRLDVPPTSGMVHSGRTQPPW